MDRGAGEQVLLQVRTHPKVLFVPAVTQVALLVAHIVFWRYFPDSTGVGAIDTYAGLVVHGFLLTAEVWFAVIPALRWHFARFEVTDRRIRQRWGVLNKHSREIHLDRITQVNEERSLWDRLFRCGTIIVHDAANAEAIRFRDVPRFRLVRDTIDDARYAVRSPGQW